jgi:hypothetical protein
MSEKYAVFRHVKIFIVQLKKGFFILELGVVHVYCISKQIFTI